MHAVELSQVTKRFGHSIVAVDNIDLVVPTGAFVTLLGPSGCGKTTTLRMIAGLESPSAGEIRIKGQRINELPIHKRNLGIVFQNYALFPHKTIAANVGFGLKYRNVAPDEIGRRVARALEMVRLPGVEDRYPQQLSGGQQQRIALARALATAPRLLLLDEPLSALDAIVRVKLRQEIRSLQRQLGVTTIMVTHDQEEALSMSDRVVVMNHGRIEQQGAPDEVYDHPATPFVLQFLGDVNLFHGRFGHSPGGVDGEAEVSYVRPHELDIVGSAEAGALPVTLSQVLTVGAQTRIEFKRQDDGSYVDVEMPRSDFAALRERLGLRSGSQVHLRARRITRFGEGARAAQELPDPAAMI
jgi:sulfate transport system ATP-binding protein